MSIAPSSPSSIPASTGTRFASRARLLPATALAILTALLAPAVPAEGAIVEEIVAKVNNRIVTKSEFEERGSYVLKQIYQQYSGAELDRELVDAQESMLANMITELLLIDRAESLLDLSKVRKNLVDDFRKQQNIASDEDLDKLLKEQGMTRQDLEEQLVRLAVPQEIISYEVRRKISVSEPEIKKYYEDHQANWETPATVTFNEIVLFYEDATKPEVLSRAQGIVREANAGTDFGELVQRHSEAPSKESGGFLGPFPASDLQTAIAEAAFRLEAGQVSEPIDTGRSYLVIRLVGKTDRVVKTIDEAREATVKAVREGKFRPRYNTYIKKLWKDNQIEISPKYEHFLVRSPLKQGPGGQAPAPIGGKEEVAPPEKPGDAE
ncbi:MAG TPA: peptidyl-prolyl cis-trans isomerase [Candidatus Polarisedimenticolia bacterium]|jgi:parvulin-like peptidyl-prolyl isomerase|nr:peptidyl-prolyl cis-trans isomerase [Candidatus Polarisedimenticolia bacterium]